MSQISELVSPETILDSLADGVFTVDEQWRVTSLNRAAQELTGISLEDALGRPCCEVFRASACQNGCALKSTFATGRPLADRPIYLTAADGRRVLVSVSTSLLRDADDEAIGGVVAFRRVTGDEELYESAGEGERVADIIGRSESMKRIFRLLPQFANSTSTVLIEGGSGTGKELFARAIHRLSPRRDKRFVAVNCSALPDTLLESELFGYKAGAFTDARQDKPGRFAVANGGAIFLDEIGDISPAMQTKLLRVLQERVFEPLGSVDPVKVDVRVIAATNRDLGELVRRGSFREDLFYRVNIVRLQLPPLSERREDIPLLVEHFVRKFNRQQGKRIIGVSDEAIAVLMAHEYRGNVRELENIIEHAFVLCRGGLIERRHLPDGLRDGCSLESVDSRRGLTLRDRESLHIIEAIRRNGGNRSAAARELGIHCSTLYRKIKSLDLPVPAQDGRSRRKR